MKFNDSMYSKVGLGTVISAENARLQEQAKRLPGGEQRLGEGRVNDDHRNIPEQRQLAGITRKERLPQASHGGFPIYRANGSGMLESSDLQTLAEMGVTPKMPRLFENSTAHRRVVRPTRRPPHLKFMVTSREAEGVNVEEEKQRVAETLRRLGYDVVECEEVESTDEAWAVRNAPGQEDMDASRDMDDAAITRERKSARRQGRHNESVERPSLIRRVRVGG